MPIDKEASTFQTSIAVGAGGSQLGPVIDLRKTHGTRIYLTVTNGGTGPTSPHKARIRVSTDNFAGDDVIAAEYLAKLGANDVTVLEHVLGREILYARTEFVAGAGEGCTVAAIGHTINRLG